MPGLPLGDGVLDELRRAVEDRSPADVGRAVVRTTASLAESAADGLDALLALAQVGLLRPLRPDQAVGMLVALRRWGLTPAGGYATSALRQPSALALIDEAGSLTFDEVHRRTTSLANGLADAGIGEGDNVGVLCRNHRGFIEATVALSKLGANALYLNTSFAGPQLSDVLRAERATALIYDQEFTEPASTACAGGQRFVSWVDDPREYLHDQTLDELILAGATTEPAPPTRPGRQVILTSGTTGRPKGANRGIPNSIDPLVTLLSRIPLRYRDTALVSAPLFHAWGLGNLMISLASGATVVLHRRFDPEAVLAAVEEHRVNVLAAVPVMIQRILALPEPVRRRYRTDSLRVVALSGSALSPEVATGFMDEFGDVIYSLYGSTEAGWVAIATPEDLRADPGTAGFPPRGTRVRIVDDYGRDVPVGQAGRIFVGSDLLFEGYTGGDGKEMIDGLMATGDLGHLDESGRLFVEGREDEMIVSGGENIFPQEIEELMRTHNAVADVAVVGVPDEQFGQRLEAFVTTEGDERVTADELKSYVRSNLSRYKVPRQVSFVDSLPRNAAGKVIKRELV